MTSLQAYSTLLVSPPPLPPPFDRSVVRGSQRNRPPPPPPGWGQDGGTDSHQDACSETELIFSVQEYIADVSQLSKFDKESEVLLVPWLRFTVLQVPSSHVILDAIFFFVALETQTPPKGWGGGAAMLLAISWTAHLPGNRQRLAIDRGGRVIDR